MTPEQKQRLDMLEGLAIGLEARGEKSAAHLIRLTIKDLRELHSRKAQ